MELTERTAGFRSRYRSNISVRYSGYLHALFVFGAGSLLTLYCYAQAATMSPAAWLAVPAALLLANLGEYFAHKSLGHHKRRFAKLFYSRHTGDHHSFFNHRHYTIDNQRDLRVVLFPAYLLVAVVVLVAAPLGALVGAAFGAAAGWVFAGTLIAGYLLYEFVHLCAHLPDHYRITRWPGIRQLREHHRQHHDPGLARESNFNVSLPISDYLFGTKHRLPAPDAQPLPAAPVPRRMGDAQAGSSADAGE